EIIASMEPEQVQQLQQQNVLPPNPELKKQLKEADDSILEKMSDELKEYFDYLEEEEEELDIEPAEITDEEQTEQQKAYKEQLKLEEQGSAQDRYARMSP